MRLFPILSVTLTLAVTALACATSSSLEGLDDPDAGRDASAPRPRADGGEPAPGDDGSDDAGGPQGSDDAGDDGGASDAGSGTVDSGGGVADAGVAAHGQCAKTSDCPAMKTGLTACVASAPGGFCNGCQDDGDCDFKDSHTYTCTLGSCKQDCTATADCPTGLRCHATEKVCVLQSCTKPGDCPDAYACDGGFCRRPACTPGDGICPDGKCVGGYCMIDR